MAFASHGVLVSLLDIRGWPLPSFRSRRSTWCVGTPRQHFQVLVEVVGGHGALFTVCAEVNGQRLASQVINTHVNRKCWFTHWPPPSGRILMLAPSAAQTRLLAEVRVSVSRVEVGHPQAWAPTAPPRPPPLRTVERLPDVRVCIDTVEALFLQHNMLRIPQHTAILRTSSHPAVTQALAAAHNAAVAAAAQQGAAARVAAQQAAAAKEAAAKEAAAARAAAAQQAAAKEAEAKEAAAKEAREAAAQEAAAREAAAREAAAQQAAAAAQAALERADKHVPKAAGEIIDLTHEEPVLRLVVDGREQRWDELACCDLAAEGDSDDDEDAEQQEVGRARKKPRWALVKKPVVDLVEEEGE